MTRKRRKCFLIAAAALVVVLALLTAGAFFFGPFEDVAPREFSGAAAHQAFRTHFPPIYHLVAEDERYEVAAFRVLMGLGGRWGKVTLVRRNGEETSREGIVDELQGRFAASGWKLAPEEPVVREVSDASFDAQKDQLSADDARLSHASLPGEREHVFHNCRLFVSPGADHIVVYCEMGW